MSTKKVHFLGTVYASRAACGRMILAWRDDAPEHSDDVEAVTCAACLSVLSNA